MPADVHRFAGASDMESPTAGGVTDRRPSWSGVDGGAMARVRFLFVLFSALALVVAVAAPAGAVPADTAAAVGYLDTQQRPGTDPSVGDGSWDWDEWGFGLSEFNTGEVVLAIASQAQTGDTWNPTQARNAVASTTNAAGANVFGFLDWWTRQPLIPGQAVKMLLTSVLPLDDGTPGFGPFAYDPLGDGDPVDLVALMGAGPDGCDDVAGFGFLGETMAAMQVVYLLCGQAGPASVQTVRDAQKADGGWSFDGDPTDATEAEIDMVGMAIAALVAGGVPGDDPAILDGLRFLAERQEPEGWWASLFDPASPDSTSRAIIAITAAGWDVNSSGWKDYVLDGVATAQDYVSPDDGLGALQQPDGSIVGPQTFSGVFSTAQATQALERNWLPVATTTAPGGGGPGPGGDPEGTGGDPTAPPAEVVAVDELAFTGGVRDVLPLAIVGIGMIAVGTLLARVRTREGMGA